MSLQMLPERSVAVCSVRPSVRPSVRLSVCLSVCLSACPSVCPIYRPLQRRAAGLLPGTPRVYWYTGIAGPIDRQRRVGGWVGAQQQRRCRSAAHSNTALYRSAANASSVTFTATVEG